MVLDADALVAFQGAVEELRQLAEGRPVVLTPHPGEFRTLFPDLASQRELDPWGAAAAAAERTGAVVLLKGVPTVVASTGPSRAHRRLGQSRSRHRRQRRRAERHHRHRAGAAPRAGASPRHLGAQALGRSADIAARRVSARSLRPMDVIAALPDLWREWELLRRSPPPPHPPVLLELSRPQTL